MKVVELKAVLTVVLCLVTALAQAADPGFPGRSKFPGVAIYTKTQLKQNMAHVVLVDARSKYEFDTLSIKGAINIPVASKTFVAQVKALRAKTSEPIVFYCNGRACMKSYLAAKKARVAGVANIHAYDAGMFEWAESYPADSILFREHTLKPGDIISIQRYDKHLLSPNEFSNDAYKLGDKSWVLDVRDKYQRGAAGLFPGMEQWISLDHEAEIRAYIQKAEQENKTLFVYDQVGEQVQWLQYALVREHMKNYYFMKGGAVAYYAELEKQMGITH